MAGGQQASLPQWAVYSIFALRMKRDLWRIYQRLHAHFGPQGWWPTTPPGEKKPRYYPGEAGRLLSEAEKWEIAAGAILTQNTAWRNAERALEALCAAGALDLRVMAGLDEPELAALIRASGYYNQKARLLRELVRYIAENYQGRIGRLLQGEPGAVRQELLSLWGIGPETADSILLYAGGHPVFVVDAYTRRICTRLGLVGEDIGYAVLQESFMEELPGEAALFNEYHALLVRHAVVYCRTEPLCASCCLRQWCKYGKNRKNTAEEKT